MTFSLLRAACHFPARFRAAPASLCARLHHLIVCKAFAIFGAALAHLGADSTGMWMQVRITQHEIGAGLAYLGAIQEQADVIWMGMFSSQPQAMRHRR
jgi:hypothetical protein